MRTETRGEAPLPASGAKESQRLFLLHDPDPVPCFVRRAGLIVAAAVVENAGWPILQSEFESRLEMAEATLPIAPLIAIDTGLVGPDHRGELRKGAASVMPERF